MCVCMSVCLSVGGVDTSVHFESQSAADNSFSGGGGGLISVDDVYHGTKAALSAGNTTVG